MLHPPYCSKIFLACYSPLLTESQVYDNIDCFCKGVINQGAEAGSMMSHWYDAVNLLLIPLPTLPD